MAPTTLRSRVLVFALTFASYAFFHAGRKAFSAIKPVFVDTTLYPPTGYLEGGGGLSQNEMLGLLDTLFLFCYSAGLYGSGWLADRHDLRVVSSIGLALSAALTALFGLGGLVGLRSLWYFALLWALNGLAQSTGWPANVAIMGNWFEGEGRGAVFGVWTANASFGNILGTGFILLLLHLVGDEEGWKLSLLFAGGLMLCQAVLVACFLRPHPPSEALLDGSSPGASAAAPLAAATEEETSNLYNRAHWANTESTPPPAKAVTLLGALLIPGVLPYALCYACLKGVNYAFFFWLPTLLSGTGMSSTQSDLFSMLFDAGQILGGTLSGHFSDKMSSRAPLTAAMLLASAPVAWFTQGRSTAGLVPMLLLLGGLLGGPANMISGCISADLGQHPSLKGNERAIATVTGVIDGTGSLGAAAAQYVVGALAPPASACGGPGQPPCDWSAVFTFLLVMLCVAALCLSPMLVAPLRTAVRRPSLDAPINAA